jgi:hypothetical protein
MPLEVVEVCRKALQEVTVGAAGWDFAGVQCDGGSLNIMWTRRFGFAGAPPDSVVSDSGDSASRSIPLDFLDPRGDEDLIDPEVVMARYMAQNWTGTITRLPDDPPPPPPPGYKGEWAPPPPPWIKRSFTLSVPVLPWTIPTFLGDLPGVVVNSLILDGQGTSWTIEGVIYENRR